MGPGQAAHIVVMAIDQSMPQLRTLHMQGDCFYHMFARKLASIKQLQALSLDLTMRSHEGGWCSACVCGKVWQNVAALARAERHAQTRGKLPLAML